MPRRLYIYRKGATDAFAVTADKSGANLPLAMASDGWRFWMQIGPVQCQGGCLGFDVRAAVHAIVTDGFHLFSGSSALFGEYRHRPREHCPNQTQTNA